MKVKCYAALSISKICIYIYIFIIDKLQKSLSASTYKLDIKMYGDYKSTRDYDKWDELITFRLNLNIFFHIMRSSLTSNAAAGIS